jgi:hypothetical protein
VIRAVDAATKRPIVQELVMEIAADEMVIAQVIIHRRRRRLLLRLPVILMG